MLDITWRDTAALLTVATIIGTMVVAWVRWQLRGDFAGKADIATLGTRMEDIETRLRAVPTHEDVRRISERLGTLESGFASVGGEVRGMREGIARVERDLHLLLQHELAKGKPAT